MTERPLSGLRILDFSHAAAGPFATMMMADLGADVIKIEKPGRGDGARHMGAQILGALRTDFFVSVNRNKRAVALNLHTEEGRDLARELVMVSDIVVQNFRPGVMDRLGLGFADLAPLRPGLIYCSMSAFGSSGPLVDRAANDMIMQAMSGVMSVTGELGGTPAKVGTALSDYTTGLYGIVGILAALHTRDAHPEGQHIEVAMLDATLSLMAAHVPSVLALGAKVPRTGARHDKVVPYQAFECSDGAYVMVGAFTQGFWRRLCDAVGHPEWPADQRFATNADRLLHQQLLIPQLERIFRTRPRDEWLKLLDGADVPAAPVSDLREALTSDQARHNQVVHDVGTSETPCPTIRFPVRSSSWPLADSSPPPVIGENSGEVLRDLLRRSDSEIQALVEADAVGVVS